ncbi:MAG: hypothetical protein C4560_09780 [Nitrospiraceae bacterium]|nr:MAG: hypothetical protein C4560_09780 [Nitrospiraceae bacterium]
MKKQNRVIVIGLDGGTLDLIDPWMSAGHLPNLKKISGSGVKAPLRSVILPFTPQAWSSFMTGVNPGVHGIFGFKEIKQGTYGFQFVNHKKMRVKNIWNLLSEAGKKVISINIPMTYPPEPINGVMISGMDAPGAESEFVYPAELKKEIFNIAPGYTIHLHVGAGYLDSDSKRRAGLKGLMDMVENREKIVLHFLEKYEWDFFAVNFAATDQVQHHYWEYMNKESEFKDAVLRIYKRVDEAVGRITRKLDDRTTLFIMSDHGAGPASDRVFFIDEWLRQNRYLEFASRSPLKGAVRQTVRLALDTLSRNISSNAKDGLMRKFPGLRVRSQGFIRRSLIKWSDTQVFSGEHPATLRINLKGREPQGTVAPGKEKDELCKKLIDELESLVIPDTGERLVEKVYRREDLYHGPCTGISPDLYIITRDFSHQVRGGPYPPGLGYKKVIEKKNHREFFVNGVHRMNGVFMAQGPDIVPGLCSQHFSIMDLFPSILYCMGLEIPLGLDGKILESIFDKSFMEANPAKYMERDIAKAGNPDGPTYESDEDSRKIEKSLRGLGYLD